MSLIRGHFDSYLDFIGEGTTDLGVKFTDYNNVKRHLDYLRHCTFGTLRTEVTEPRHLQL